MDPVPTQGLPREAGGPNTGPQAHIYIHNRAALHPFLFFQILHERVLMFREMGFLASPLSQLWEGDHTLNLETTCTNRQIYKCIYGLQTVVQVVPRRESNIYSVHEAGYLCSPYWCWSPGEVVESCRPSVYTGNPGSQLLTVVKDQQDLLSRGKAGTQTQGPMSTNTSQSHFGIGTLN